MTTSYAPVYAWTCPTCMGEGMVVAINSRSMSYYAICPGCKGTGVLTERTQPATRARRRYRHLTLGKLTVTLGRWDSFYWHRAPMYWHLSLGLVAITYIGDDFPYGAGE